MRLGTLLANCAGLAPVFSQGVAAAAYDKCGSSYPASYPEPEALEAAARLRDAQRAEGGVALRRRQDDGEEEEEDGLLITTYVHVVEDQLRAGFVTDEMINDQVWAPAHTYISSTFLYTRASKEFREMAN